VTGDKVIAVRGARQHNLQNVDVDLPHGALVVITGPSGSGKSSLAFDTIYAEGQRRYVESLQAYARQFLDQLEKPDVDSITGLSPAIAVRQEPLRKSPRSTVGTITEIHDRLRVLFARVGQAHCPICGRPIRAHTAEQMIARAMSFGEGARLSIAAPIARAMTSDLSVELARLRKDGFVRARLDGVVVDLGDELRVDGKRAHDLDVIVDRVVVRDASRSRLSDSIELALRTGSGIVRLLPEAGEPELLSERPMCPIDGIVLPAITPKTFSFATPEGACPRCHGLGELDALDATLVAPDLAKSIAEGAIVPWGKPGAPLHRAMTASLAPFELDLRAPLASLEAATLSALMNGGALPAKSKSKAKTKSKKASASYDGVLPLLERRLESAEASTADEEPELLAELAADLERFRTRGTCPACEGSRLGPTARGVTVDGLTLVEIARLPVTALRARLAQVALAGAEREIASPLLREIDERLAFLDDVGVGYLSIGRSTTTLSSGEAQRIRLATRLGGTLVGVLYVLDEPSLGLHPRDTERLIRSLVRLRDEGNTVLVVEHDLDVIRAADHVVDMGPKAGALGGRIVATGKASDLAASATSVTGPYLRESVRVPKRKARPDRGALVVEGARIHNLKDVRARFPNAALTVVSGVSGSGKSSLVVSTLLPLVRGAVLRAPVQGVPGVLSGKVTIERVISVDEVAIGRTPRSTPASYVGLLAPLRELFASLPDARARGYGPARFSSNVKGGRCETCRGEGVLQVEMQLLPDLAITCPECGGRRYNKETLEVRFKGMSIADLLALSVDEAEPILAVQAPIAARLATMRELGLGYLRLGQSATTLSGGEAQRLALARELSRRASGKTLYVLDEPTTGLHPSDVELLLSVLERLADEGHTVVVIEHDPLVIARADHVVDLGPEGGDEGGRVIAEGTPREIVAARTATGNAIASLLR
jgi:excinuclease ABC subunit A